MDKLRIYVQKILPLVYDDSLSYYELLSKVVQKINELIPVVTELDSNVGEKVSEILTGWYDDGTLAKIIDEQVFEQINTDIADIKLVVEDAVEIAESALPNNKTGIHLMEPSLFYDKSYCVSGGRVNGFTCDGTYFYMASAISDDVVRIAKISMANPASSTTTTTTVTGAHPNSLSYYSGYLYMCDSNTGTVYKLNTSFTSVKTFTLDPNVNAISVKYISDLDRVYVAGIETNNNNVSLYYMGEDGLVRLVARIPITFYANCYTQGLDHSLNCIYVSRSYGDTFNDYGHYGMITAYGYNGTPLNTIVVKLDREVEDIWRDSTNDRIYFASGDGYIYYYDTTLFTRGENYHQLGAASLRELNGQYAVNGNNSDVVRQGTSVNGLMKTLKLSPMTTAYQGQLIGFGLIGGQSAIYFSRRREIIGYTIRNTTANDTDMVYGSAQFYFGSDNNIAYSGGMVMLKNGTWETLEAYHADNPTLTTVINTLTHIPFTVPYDRDGVEI